MPRPSIRPVIVNGSARCRAIRPTENTTKSPPADGKWYWRVEAPDARTAKWTTIGTFKWLTESDAELELAALLRGRTGAEAAEQKIRVADDGVETVAQLLLAWLTEQIKPAVERREAIVARRDANWSFDREDDKEKKGKLTAGKKKLPGVARTTGNAYASAARRILKAAEWAPNDPGAQLGSVKLDDLRRNGSAATLTAYYDARLKQHVRQNGGGLVTVEDEQGEPVPKLTAENSIRQEFGVLAAAWRWGVGARYCRGPLTLPEMGAADDATEEPHRMPTRGEADKVLPLLRAKWERDVAFVLAELGCRPEAMYSLRHHEVDTQGKRVRLNAKGFDRTVRVPGSVIAVLSTHLKPGSKKRLWPVTKKTMQRMLPQAFATAIARYNKDASEEDKIEPFGPYGLRSLASREHILAGTPPHTYARLMGHSAVRALADYAGVLPDDEAAAQKGLEQFREAERAKLRAV